MKVVGLAGAAALALALAGCGGGGGNPGECYGGPQTCGGVTPTPPPSTGDTPVGLFKGTTGSGRIVYGLVRTNGEIWLLYGNSGSASTLSGVEEGTYTATNGTITSSNLADFNSGNTAVTAGSLAGSYATRATLAATVSLPAGPANFSAVYDTGFTTQGTLAAAAGTYTGTAVTAGLARAATATVDNGGVITGSTADACNFSGNLQADAGVSTYSASLTFSGAGCPQSPPLSSGGGVALLDGTRLYLAVFNGGRSQGFAFSGGR